MAATTQRHLIPNYVDFVEASAIYKGLRMAITLGLHPLVIELNSKNVVDLIQDNIKTCCKIG